MKELNAYEVEVYTLNPDTGESGWDIIVCVVVASSRADARAYLKLWPLFDCVITWQGIYPATRVEGSIFNTDNVLLWP